MQDYRNMYIPVYMQVVFLSLAWCLRIVMFQPSGFDCSCQVVKDEVKWQPRSEDGSSRPMHPELRSRKPESALPSTSPKILAGIPVDCP